ncbi:MAG TPA: penicillin-binding transpeptidase domain-containing protein, partial [Streptosporangiaceae bacterium]|nr:penicillin-binding transpeptidase domain-containing protein [Streptosporangiaceae bacterium]
MWLPVAVVLAAVLTTVLSGCGPTTPSASATLSGYLAAWGRGDWTAMRHQVAAPPADFRPVNAGVFAALGVTHASFTAGRVTMAASGKTARARVTEHFDLPQAGAWNPVTTVHLADRKGGWRVVWSPKTINPALGAGDTIAMTRVWPPRAPVLGAGGVPLTQTVTNVIAGVVGSRIASPSAVREDLLAAGATGAQADHALAQAKLHPDFFEPVFTVSAARFAQLKAAPGPDNVYAVRGTEFENSTAETAITKQLGAQVVGSLGPVTAQQLHALGAPYNAAAVVGQTGIEAAQERALAGTPSTHVDVQSAGGTAVTRLATFPGHPGTAVSTSLDPRVQRAAEAALATSKHPDVAMVAMRASTGQVLAIASNPVSGYDTALQGAYPPGSTFKVLTSTALFRHGLTPASPASCPPTLTIDGETFHNAEGDQPVSNMNAAFVESCNTAFLGLATAHLSPADFTAAAQFYGLQRTPMMGLPAFAANVPAPASPTALAADAMGQGNLTFSPLGMASVAAAIDSGTVHAPRLVAGAPDDTLPPSPLSAGIVNDLRGMMAGVVASGTAAGTGLPAGTHAKTGTAEFGT